MFELSGKRPSVKERFARLDIISDNTLGQALITDVGTKSAGDDLADIEVINLNTSAGVTIGSQGLVEVKCVETEMID